jgi:hypothetical protein
MAETPSQPRSGGPSDPDGGPRAPSVPRRSGEAHRRPSDSAAAQEPGEGARSVREPGVQPEPRSFGSDDMEGVRAGPKDEARRFADYGGQARNEADELPSGVSRTPAGRRPPA